VTDDTLARLAARVAELERAEQARQDLGAGRTPARPAADIHDPRPGTWAGDEQTAECRYCGQPINRTPDGRWWYLRDQHCPARAAGAPAKD
jgi:hypothetical protein